MIDDYEPMIPDSWWDRQVGGSPEEKTIARLRAENDKLRKYAELYAGAAKTNCDICPYCDDFEICKDAEAEPMSEGCALYVEMRELRIEVDG
jgi:hypothetical protein